MKRKDFLMSMGLGIAATGTSHGSLNKLTKPSANLSIGLASYTLRKYSLDELIDIMLRLGMKDVCLKSFHLPYEASSEELSQIVSKLKARGLNPYGAGVIYFKTEEEVEKHFNYAKAAGIGMIVGAPEHHLLPLIEKKVKETNIKLAIHNHGPEDRIFPSPETVYEKIKDLDHRIGLCIDCGHTFRMNQDPATEIKRFKDRLFDCHLKDLEERTLKAMNIEVGRGVMDIPSIIKALKEINYTGVVGMEYEKDADHAAYGLTESVGYVRGILKMTN